MNRITDSSTTVVDNHVKTRVYYGTGVVVFQGLGRDRLVTRFSRFPRLAVLDLNRLVATGDFHTGTVFEIFYAAGNFGCGFGNFGVTALFALGSVLDDRQGISVAHQLESALILQFLGLAVQFRGGDHGGRATYSCPVPSLCTVFFRFGANIDFALGWNHGEIALVTIVALGQILARRIRFRLYQFTCGLVTASDKKSTGRNQGHRQSKPVFHNYSPRYRAETLNPQKEM